MMTQAMLPKIKLLLSTIGIIIGCAKAAPAQNLVIKDVSFDTLEQIMAIDEQVSFEYYLPIYPFIKMTRKPRGLSSPGMNGHHMPELE